MVIQEQNKGHLEVPPSGLYQAPTTAFVESFGRSLGVSPERLETLERATQSAFQLLVRRNQGKVFGDRIGIDVFERDGNLVVELLNRGEPIFLDPDEADVFVTSDGLDSFRIENGGRQGQTLMLSLRMGAEAIDQRKSWKAEEDPEYVPRQVEIRDLREGEEEALSRLFFSVYGYHYINDYVYFPEKLRALREEGKLLSFVAADGDRLLGHVGLMRWKDDPVVWEPCLGVTDPRVKSQGVFSKIFHRTMDHLRELPMQYSFFDFVTNHEYSQKLVAQYEPVPMALMIGSQSHLTQARLEKLGIGKDPKESERYSILYSIRPGVEHPFGKQVTLPSSLGELLGYLLRPLNLTWVPGSRFELLPPDGSYETHLEPAQNAVVFDFTHPGRRAVERMLDEWMKLQKRGYQYVGIDVPLASRGIGNLYDILAEEGFFVGGFLPYRFSRELCLRLQSLGQTPLDLDEIRVYGDSARRLFATVRESLENNTEDLF